MSFRFLHAADIHLGFRQYGSRERFDDFSAAFDQVIDHAVANAVDCVIIAGDLFHKRSIDPTTLYVATQGLIRLRNARIKAVCVQGNHELADPRQKTSWLDFLARMGLLVVLMPPFKNQKPQIVPWDPVACRGAYIDLTPDVRVWGVKYVGASIRRMLAEMAEAFEAGGLDRAPYTIAALHTGLEGQLDHYAGNLGRADLDIIRPHCDYLALGHIHKPYEQDNWVYNPGSTETNSLTEWFWEDRGFYDVTVEQTVVDGQPAWRHTAVKVPTKRRRFLPITLKVVGLETFEALSDAVDRELARHQVADERPVVELRLTGVLEFDRAQLDRDAIEERVRQAYDPIVCRVKDNTQSADHAFDTEEDLSSEQLERLVLQEMVAGDASRRERAAEWAEMILSVKQLALGSPDPEPLIGEVVAFCERLDAVDDAPSDHGSTNAPDGGLLGEEGAAC